MYQSPIVAAAAAALLPLFTAHTEKDESTGSRLISAVVVFRHGARTPVFLKVPGLREQEWGACSGVGAAVNLRGVEVRPKADSSSIDLKKTLALQFFTFYSFIHLLNVIIIVVIVHVLL